MTPARAAIRQNKLLVEILAKLDKLQADIDELKEAKKPARRGTVKNEKS